MTRVYILYTFTSIIQNAIMKTFTLLMLALVILTSCDSNEEQEVFRNIQIENVSKPVAGSLSVQIDSLNNAFKTW